MIVRNSHSWSAMTLILLCSLVRPAVVQAACNYAMPANIDSVGSMTIVVSKFLTSAPTPACASIPSQKNAVDCNPGSGGGTTTLLTADAMTATINPRCVWNCDCGTVTIDGSDGLPVELMEFEINP